jgi:hypothetical protein
VQPARANINPAPIAPETIDRFVIAFLLHELLEPNLRAGQLTNRQISGDAAA